MRAGSPLARGGALCYLRGVHFRNLPAWLLSSATALAPAAALAHGGGAAMPSEVPALAARRRRGGAGHPARARGEAGSRRRRHEGRPRKPAEGEAAQVTAEPVKSAKRALERAHGARAAGDEPHARMLDGLALEWAEAARDLDRAAAAEARRHGHGEEGVRGRRRRRSGRGRCSRRRRRAAGAPQRSSRASRPRPRTPPGAPRDAEAQRLDAAKERRQGGAGKAPAGGARSEKGRHAEGAG